MTASVGTAAPDVRLSATCPPWLLMAFVLTAIAFVALPQIDLAASRLFTDAQGHFALARDPVLFAINRSITWISRVAVIVLALAALFAWVPWLARAAAPAWLVRQRRAVLFVLAALALGPGLLVNTVLKDNSGRARPEQVAEFGGPARFTPPFAWSDQCRRNCAFVSGHAAVAAMPFAGYFIARSQRARRRWLAAGIVAGLTIGLLRMLTGSHFLSDVVIAIFFVWFVTAACAAVLLRARGEHSVAGEVQS
jgi:lipid A 4'-phosphatase